VPARDAPLVEQWDQKALLYDYCDQRAERFTVDQAILPDTTHVWGDLEWRALAAPGHAMGALVFHNAERGILISGDALWEQGFGFVMPPEVDPDAMPATRATLEMLSKLDVRVVIPGHGEPFTDVSGALERAFARVTAFEADSLRVARHALKVSLTFALLDQRRLPLADMPAYFDRVGLYRDFNALFFRLPAADLAELLIAELERAGAVKREEGWLVPANPIAG
jgi:glyoxylase-like metal-dependent hydrolase (beta-lactamase superfamily II)